MTRCLFLFNLYLLPLTPLILILLLFNGYCTATSPSIEYIADSNGCLSTSPPPPLPPRHSSIYSVFSSAQLQEDVCPPCNWIVSPLDILVKIYCEKSMLNLSFGILFWTTRHFNYFDDETSSWHQNQNTCTTNFITFIVLFPTKIIEIFKVTFYSQKSSVFNNLFYNLKYFFAF